jgi:hypothetical protein
LLSTSGFPQLAVVAEAEQAVKAARSAAMFAAITQPQLTFQDFDIWKPAQPHGLGGPEAAGLYDGVLAADYVDALRVVAARAAVDAGIRDVRADD